MKRTILAVLLLAFVGLGVPASFTGCASGLEKPGAYNGDLALYNADLATKTAYDALNAFVSWEYANRASLFAKNPQIKRSADGIRANAPGWFAREAALRAAYIALPSDANLSSLKGILAVIQAALADASQHLKTTTP